MLAVVPFTPFRVTRLCLSLVSLLLAAPLSAQRRPCDPPNPLGPSRTSTAGRSSYPHRGPRGAAGTVELGQVPGPFTVAVTADGFPRYRLALDAAGLPAPSALGKFATYVAWVAPPAMHPVRRLGEVGNGRTALGDVDLEKFVVLITAERDARVKEPEGKVVLRGQSPSTRLFPPDLLEFSIGRMGSRSEHAGHGAHDSSAAGPQWAGVPMPPGLTMLPAEMALRPDVTPFLPSGEAPAAHPRQTVRIRSGDTLHLEAGLVRRSLKGQHLHHVRLQRAVSRPAHRGRARVGADRHLPQPAAACIPVHWHGLRLDSRSDGVRTSPSPRCRPAASSPITFASLTRGYTGITRTSGRISSRSSASTATCWSGRTRATSTVRPIARPCSCLTTSWSMTTAWCLSGWSRPPIR